ncbi:MAG: NAD+ synthase [Nanoarchaeota archaeon]|nr:NAD+ synthase [Nanoarchaeota archaeon]
MKEKVEKIVEWIKRKVKEANADGVIVGLSGGIDSSCVAILCKKAFPNNVKGVMMPCLSNPEDIEHAELIANKFIIPFEIVDLEEGFKTLFKSINNEIYDKRKHNNLAVANIKPRLRMTTLYYLANKLNYLVVGTDNKSEEMIGYFTKYGDGGVDISPIVNLYKKDVRELAEFLEIPKNIITKKPSAGLWDGQTDEDEMGMSYEELDEILEELEQNNNFESFKEDNVRKVKEMISKSEHKRRIPFGCKLNGELK